MCSQVIKLFARKKRVKHLKYDDCFDFDAVQKEKKATKKTVHMKIIMIESFFFVSHLIHGWVYMAARVLSPFRNAQLMIVVASILRLIRLLTEQLLKRLIAIDHRASASVNA